MQTADDRDVLDQLESDLLAVEAALAELDRLAEDGPTRPSGDGSAPEATDGGGVVGEVVVDRSVGHRDAILAVLSDQRFGRDVDADPDGSI